VGGLGKFVGMSRGVAKVRRSERELLTAAVMLTMFSATGTSKVVGVVAAAMMLRRGLGQLVLGVGVGVGCSVCEG
jgi:hypothetical protein